MSRDKNSTRRSFLKNGALLAAPLAAAAPSAVLGDDGLKARLARLENEAAIRDLHQNWLRGINTGAQGAVTPLAALEGALAHTIRSITTDHAGKPDAIEIAPGGQSATGRFHYVVELERNIPQDCTLARMAHAQGGGFVRWTDRCVLHVEYVKASATWTIAKAELAPGLGPLLSLLA